MAVNCSVNGFRPTSGYWCECGACGRQFFGKNKREVVCPKCVGINQGYQEMYKEESNG